MLDFSDSSVNPIQLGELILLAAVLVISVYMELKEKRIPNGLTFSAIVCGLVLGTLPGGISLVSSALGFGLGFGVLFVFYLFGGMGGGDVKLMGAVGALMGYPFIVPALVNTAVIGGVMAIFIVIWRLDFKKLAGIPARQSDDKPSIDQSENQDKRKTTIPYGVAIATGCLMTLYLQ